MFDRLEEVEDRYDELNELLSDPQVISDTERFMKLSKEEAELRETVATFRKYRSVVSELKDTEEM
ncbi:MAG: PCRF domain-containing protein, partial [Alkalibacterium gilvum]|uniref:PCRF domain-containing protein n=3 Tax=Carnobacteriaceae TaxID=186828 RepID=UPI003F9353C5